jgi:hypothetical protein
MRPQVLGPFVPMRKDVGALIKTTDAALIDQRFGNVASTCWQGTFLRLMKCWGG